MTNYHTATLTGSSTSDDGQLVTLLEKTTGPDQVHQSYNGFDVYTDTTAGTSYLVETQDNVVHIPELQAVNTEGLVVEQTVNIEFDPLTQSLINDMGKKSKQSAETKVSDSPPKTQKPNGIIYKIVTIHVTHLLFQVTTLVDEWNEDTEFFDPNETIPGANNTKHSANMSTDEFFYKENGPDLDTGERNGDNNGIQLFSRFQ